MSSRPMRLPNLIRTRVLVTPTAGRTIWRKATHYVRCQVSRAIRRRCQTCICWVRQSGPVMGFSVDRGISSRGSCWRLVQQARRRDMGKIPPALTHMRERGWWGVWHAPPIGFPEEYAKFLAVALYYDLGSCWISGSYTPYTGRKHLL